MVSQFIFLSLDSDVLLIAFSTYSAKFSDNYLKINGYYTKKSHLKKSVL